MLTFEEVSEKEVPKELLLEADPSAENIEKYLSGSRCFCVFIEANVVGVCVVKRITENCVELFNIAVLREKQNQGIGTKLLEFVIKKMDESGENRIELGTGTFGYQLKFYQRQGFRVESVWKNYFVDNYDEPIYEDGLQLKDMLRLSLEL